MTKIVLLVVLLAVGGWFWHDRNTLTPQKVEQFYDRQEHALLSRDAKALCELLADDLSGTSTVATITGRVTEELTKKTACESHEQMMKAVRDIGSSMGGIAQLDYNSRVDNVSIAANKRSAQVTHRYALAVAGRMMHISGTSQDTVGMRMGRMVLIHSEGNSRMQVIGQR